MIKIGVLGSAGRMGKTILQLINEDPSVSFVGGTVSQRSTCPNKTLPADLFKSADVLIDFSTVEACVNHVQLAMQFRKPLVIGVTGFSDSQFSFIVEAGKTVPLFLSYNMSFGISVLQLLVQKAASLLDDNYDMSLIESHHRYKKDSPSGTAKLLMQNIDRPIDVQSIRGGTVVGDHTVHFFGNHETITLQHSAQDRNIFADGSLKAAKWLVNQQNGFYDMRNLINDKLNK